MSTQKADLVLHEGIVDGHPDCDSIAVGGDRILTCGAFADLKSLVGPQTHMVRLDGRTVAPGFIDSHLHFMEGAAAAAGLSVTRCRLLPELLGDLRVAAGKTPPGNWLKAFGCDEALLQDRRGPTREELDRATPKNPLRLRHQTLHASWLNSRALILLGLERADFQPPEGAWIGRDSSGRLTGFVAGMEEWLGERMPRVTATELEMRARTYSRELAASGVTAFTDATVRNGPDEVASFSRLTSGGAIVQRPALMVGPHCIDAVTELQHAHPNVHVAGVKFMAVDRWEPARLIRAAGIALSNGADCAFHCTEVEELHAALTVIAAAQGRLSSRTLDSAWCRIEHGGLIPPEYPERIAAIGAWVVTNPGFIYYRGAKYAAEPGLAPFLYRAKSLIEAGIAVAAGSDAPVTPAKPLIAVASAISRSSVEGCELAPAEQLDIPTALGLFTTEAARLSRLAAGTIRAGYLADLIVLPANPLTLSAAELIKLPVDLTIIGGRVVYERGRPLTMRNTGTASGAS